MRLLQSFRINTRLTAGFFLALSLVAAGSAVGLWQLGKLEGLTNRLATEEARKLALAERWLRGISVNLVRAQTSLLVTDEDELLAVLKKDMDATSKEISEHESAIQGMVAAEQGRQILERISALREKYRTLRAQLIKRRVAGEDVREGLRREMIPAADGYLAAVREFVEWQVGRLEAARAEARDAAVSGRAFILSTALAGLIAGLAIALVLSRSIVRPIARVRDAARRIAQGDLAGATEVTGRDETAEMLQAVNEMQSSLRQLVEDVRAGAQDVSVASSQIAVGNTDLSSRTEQQASSIEETAASVEELTSTVSQNAANATQADVLAAAAAKVAAGGGEIVARVVSTMDEIAGSSKRISEIIGVIDGIAFQTNILALNAAVEAARAGEQGRGFAVVASEVRSLAQRSADAAKEIKGLIGSSVKTVDSGSRLVEEAGRTMREVVASVKQVSELIGQIAVATQEQSAGIGQVNTAITELDRATQQNAALVEESAAASEGLKQQAMRLAESVAVFKLGREAPVHHAPAVVSFGVLPAAAT